LDEALDIGRTLRHVRHEVLAHRIVSERKSADFTGNSTQGANCLVSRDGPIGVDLVAVVAKLGMVDLGDVGVHRVDVFPLRAARALLVVATGLIVLRSVRDLVESPAITPGHPLLARVLKVAVKLALVTLKSAASVRVEAGVVFPLEEGHEHFILLVGGLGVEGAGITGSRAEQALDGVGALIYGERVEVK
jgi:hypothetical protein